jgi:hypothetical protein
MKLLKKLYNPFALGVQGFALGAVLFFSTHPDSRESVLDKIGGTPAAEARQGSAA